MCGPFLLLLWTVVSASRPLEILIHIRTGTQQNAHKELVWVRRIKNDQRFDPRICTRFKVPSPHTPPSRGSTSEQRTEEAEENAAIPGIICVLGGGRALCTMGGFVHNNAHREVNFFHARGHHLPHTHIYWYKYKNSRACRPTCVPLCPWGGDFGLRFSRGEDRQRAALRPIPKSVLCTPSSSK